MSSWPTVTQLMHSGRSDCKAFTLHCCIDISSVERAGLNIPFTGAGVSWLALLRQKQWCPLRDSSRSPSNTNAPKLVVLTCAAGTAPDWLFPLSPVTHPLALGTNRLGLCRGFLGESDLPPAPGAPREHHLLHHWLHLGSHDASCLLHSFPECLGPARKLTIVFVPGAFCSVLMSNSCN